MKTILLIGSFWVCLSTAAQKMPSDYFYEASNAFEVKNLKAALYGFGYIVRNYPKNELFPKAFYNTGYIYFLQKDYDRSIPVFRQILVSDFKEKESLGGGIMDDPYANFRHRASQLLSEIFFQKKQYDSSLYYFALSDTANPYLHFCGNAYAENDVFTALRYAEIYKKLKQPDKAIEKLLPAVFISLANNSKVLAELEKLLSGKKQLKEELDQALHTMYPDNRKINSDEQPDYFFKFLNTPIAVSGIYKEKEFNKEQAIKAIRESDFYKMIEKLK